MGPSGPFRPVCSSSRTHRGGRRRATPSRATTPTPSPLTVRSPTTCPLREPPFLRCVDSRGWHTRTAQRKPSDLVQCGFVSPDRRQRSPTGDLRRGRCTTIKCCSANAHPAFLCIDRKSTRLNSSHLVISYAVFCLKK